jgi:hypothetical protein
MDLTGDASRAKTIGGWAVLGALVAGTAALLLGLMEFMGHPEAAGLCFLAAAVAFGGVANAIFRN